MLGGRIKDLVLLLYLYPINKICFVSSFFRPAIGLYFIWLVYSRLRGLRLKNKRMWSKTKLCRPDGRYAKKYVGCFGLLNISG